MENIDLNTNGIETNNINCDAIIREEHERIEKDLRLLLGAKPNVVNCILQELRNTYLDNYLDFTNENQRR